MFKYLCSLNILPVLLFHVAGLNFDQYVKAILSEVCTSKSDIP